MDEEIINWVSLPRVQTIDEGHVLEEWEIN